MLIAKLTVAAVLLGYVLAKVHWDDYTETVEGPTGPRPVACRGFRSTLTDADPPPLAAAVGCFAAAALLIAVRWWYLLRVLGIRLRLWESVRLTFLGYFFNQIVPGMISGDLVKAWYVFRHTERKPAALVSIFVDRIVGLLEFALLAAAVLLWLAASGRWDHRFQLPAAGVAVVLAAIAAGVAAVTISPLRRLLARTVAFGPLKRPLAVAGQAVAMYRRRVGALARALGMTTVSQVIHVAGVLLIGRALGLPIEWYEYFLYVPLAYIIAAVPVSPGGLGVLEWCFVTFFAAGDASVSEAMALALLARLGPIIVSLPGLVVAVTGPKLPRPESIEAVFAEPAPGEEQPREGR